MAERPVGAQILSVVQSERGKQPPPRSFLSEENTSHHDHVRINIDTGEDRIQHHQFLIDSQLRRLVDNGSLRSRLFKIYLHAVTSYCLPDTLTGRTGTEEALECLAQASTQSFMTFDNHEAEFLKNLARLSPSRKYYPKHLKPMETVTWRKFPTLQQHDRFFELVESIKARAASVQVFQQSQISALQLDMPRKFPELYMRAKIRLSNIRVDGYGAEDFTTKPDLRYLGRDQSDREISCEMQVFAISKLVDNWSKKNLKYCPRLLSKFESWGTPISGLSEPFTLGFSNILLDKPSELYPSMWCTFQVVLDGCNPQNHKYKVMSFLSTLAQSPHADTEIIHVLLAFATMAKLATRCLMPACKAIDLNYGYAPDRDHLMTLFKRHQRPFEQSIEVQFSALPGESKKATYRRRKAAFDSSVMSKLVSSVQNLVAQSPGSVIVWPTTQNLGRYVVVDDVKPAVLQLFDDWKLSQVFEKYVKNFAEVMKNEFVVEEEGPELHSFTRPRPLRPTVHRHIGAEDLFGGNAPQMNSPCAYQSLAILQAMVHNEVETSGDCQACAIPGDASRSGTLQDLLTRLASRAQGAYEENYVQDLEKSYAASAQHRSTSNLLDGEIGILVQQHLDETRGEVDDLYQKICTALRYSPTATHEVYHCAQMSPRLSPSIVLSFLSHGKINSLSNAWRAVIVQYSLAITALQRAQRLKACLQH